LASRPDILELFEQNVTAARKAITQAKDEDMGSMWTLSRGGTPFFAMPRLATARGVVNHMIRHRARLCVCLRRNDVPVPGMYGRSGDE
jgi:uncharacterized damage-inducible protein DinB